MISATAVGLYTGFQDGVVTNLKLSICLLVEAMGTVHELMLREPSVTFLC